MQVTLQTGARIPGWITSHMKFNCSTRVCNRKWRHKPRSLRATFVQIFHWKNDHSSNKKQKVHQLLKHNRLQNAWRTGFPTKHWILNEPDSLGKHMLKWMAHQTRYLQRSTEETGSGYRRVQNLPTSLSYTAVWDPWHIWLAPKDMNHNLLGNCHQMSKIHYVALNWGKQA